MIAAARRRAPRTAGFSLLEMVVTLAVTGGFLVMITGLLERSLSFAAEHQARTGLRANARFSLDFLATELAMAGGRIPASAAYYAADTINDVDDADVADLGTDTLAVMRSRGGLATQMLAGAGAAGAGTLRVAFHTTDQAGPNAICPTVAACAAAFESEHGGQGDMLLVSAALSYWVLRMTAAPTAELGAGGGIDIVYTGVFDNTGGANFPISSPVTGIEALSFRVMNETLEMKEGFFASPGDFTVMAEGVEDLQVAFVLNDGTYKNDGLPALVEQVRATAITLVGVLPADRTLGGAGTFVRPEIEDHEAGTVGDRRRRVVMRELTWGRNLAGL